MSSLQLPGEITYVLDVGTTNQMEKELHYRIATQNQKHLYTSRSRHRRNKDHLPKCRIPEEIRVLYHRQFHIKQSTWRRVLNSWFSFRRTENISASNSPTAKRTNTWARNASQNWTLFLILSIFSLSSGKPDKSKVYLVSKIKTFRSSRHLRRRMLMWRKLCGWNNAKSRSANNWTLEYLPQLGTSTSPSGKPKLPHSSGKSFVREDRASRETSSRD